MLDKSLQLKKIYSKLYQAFGPQHWWPGDTTFQVMVGAILTQNTNWGNVEKAIGNLKRAKVLTPAGLKTISTKRLARLIRPSGYFNVKAKRLKSFIKFLFAEFGGSLAGLKRVPLTQMREKLLSVKGIGPETADSILLYALDQPIFVVDAYTKRIFSRHGLVKSDDDYHCIQDFLMRNVESDLKIYNEYHALLVAAGKKFCKPHPQCAQCPLNGLYKTKC
jgi:endonuclease III related protein